VAAVWAVKPLPSVVYEATLCARRRGCAAQRVSPGRAAQSSAAAYLAVSLVLLLVRLLLLLLLLLLVVIELVHERLGGRVAAGGAKLPLVSAAQLGDRLAQLCVG
jgi:hypothetical protein